MDCPSCQAGVAPDAAFCHRCGRSVHTQSAVAGDVSKQNPRLQDGVWRWTSGDGHELLWHAGFQKWLPAGVFPLNEWARFQSLRVPSWWTVGLLALGLVFVVLGIAASADELWLAYRLDAGNFVSLDRVEANERFSTWVLLLGALTMVATIPFFIWWLYRANTNIVALGAAEQRHANGWAIGAWFIPILNLWRPVQMVRQAWRGSDEQISPQDPPDWRSRPVPGLILAWWLFWIFGSIATGITSSTANSMETLSAFKTAQWVHLVVSTSEVVTVVLAIMVVMALTRRQELAAGRWNAARRDVQPHAALRDPQWPRQDPSGIPANPRW